MSKKNKKVLCLLLGVLMVLVLALGVACQQKPPAEEQPSGAEGKAEERAPLKLTIAGSDVGGLAYIMCNAAAFRVSELVDDLEIVPTTSGGLVENIRLVKFNESQMGMSSTPALYDALNSQGEFEGEDYKGHVTVVGLGGSATYSFIVNAESDIKTLFDLKGKKISMGAPGSGSAVEGEKILKACGVFDELAEVLYLGYTDSADALRDGRIDAFVQGGSIPMPPVQELAVVKNIRLLPIDEEADKLIKKELPYFTRMVVPKGTYTNVDEDVPHVLMWRLFIARPDVPDWAIEEFTRILYTDKESMDYLVTVHPAFKDNPNYEPLPDAVAGCGAPLHPGAEKVWRELGVIK